MHGQERSAGGFREFDEILPAVGIALHFPHDTLHLLVVHKPWKRLMPWPSMKATMSSFTVVRSSGMGDILAENSQAHCMLLATSCQREPAEKLPQNLGFIASACLQFGKRLMVIGVLGRKLDRFPQRRRCLLSFSQFQVKLAHLVVAYDSLGFTSRVCRKASRAAAGSLLLQDLPCT